MANAWAPTERSVMGNMRVEIGTLTATDGASETGADATTGFNNILFAECSNSIAYLTTNGGGTLNVNTASSGDTFTCLLIGK